MIRTEMLSTKIGDIFTHEKMERQGGINTSENESIEYGQDIVKSTDFFNRLSS